LYHHKIHVTVFSPFLTMYIGPKNRAKCKIVKMLFPPGAHLRALCVIFMLCSPDFTFLGKRKQEARTHLTHKPRGRSIFFLSPACLPLATKTLSTRRIVESIHSSVHTQQQVYFFTQRKGQKHKSLSVISRGARKKLARRAAGVQEFCL
jgi:hypothetical protein